jgi:hypothetical protein
MGYLFTALLCLWLGSTIGWIYAHSVVARECERLGSFYVGDSVYKCVKIEKVDNDRTSN